VLATRRVVGMKPLAGVSQGLEAGKSESQPGEETEVGVFSVGMVAEGKLQPQFSYTFLRGIP
jgi:hypothetical protein